jgi:hypothetical protein
VIAARIGQRIGIAQPLVDHRTDRREQVLDPMRQLARQHRAMFLREFAGGNVGRKTRHRQRRAVRAPLQPGLDVHPALFARGVRRRYSMS